MPQYRFSPTRAAKHWWAIFGTAAVLLALPALLNLIVPERTESDDEIRLGSLGYGWEVPLYDPEGEPISCQQSVDITAGYLWNCDGTIVQSMITEGGTDPERTLRRMMRAMVMDFPPEQAPLFKEGDTRMLIDGRWRAVGMSVEGSGEQEGQTMVTVVRSGTDVPELADAVWYHLTDGSTLPPPVLMLLDDLTPQTPGVGHERERVEQA